MRNLLLWLLVPLALVAQDSPRALISSDFIASVEPLGNRIAQTNLTVVYLDTAADDQFVDVTAIRNDVTQFIRNTGGTAAPEAYVKAISKGLTDKYPQLAGFTITLYLNFSTSGNPGYVSTLTRLAPDLTPVLKTAVTQKLTETRNAQSRIVR